MRLVVNSTKYYNNNNRSELVETKATISSLGTKHNNNTLVGTTKGLPCPSRSSELESHTRNGVHAKRNNSVEERTSRVFKYMIRNRSRLRRRSVLTGSRRNVSAAPPEGFAILVRVIASNSSKRPSNSTVVPWSYVRSTVAPIALLSLISTRVRRPTVRKQCLLSALSIFFLISRKIAYSHNRNVKIDFHVNNTQSYTITLKLNHDQKRTLKCTAQPDQRRSFTIFCFYTTGATPRNSIRILLKTIKITRVRALII